MIFPHAISISIYSDGVRGKIGNLQLYKRPIEVAGISRILVGQSRNWTEIFIKAPKKIVSTMPCFLFTDFRHPSLNVSQPGKCEASLCCVFCRPYRHQNAIQIRLSLFSLVIWQSLRTTEPEKKNTSTSSGLIKREVQNQKMISKKKEFKVPCHLISFIRKHVEVDPLPSGLFMNLTGVS